VNKGEKRVIAEQVASTVRVLELLGFQYYRVLPPRNERRGGNKSPRVVYVYAGADCSQEDLKLRIYNSAGGHTWANKPDGTPVDVGSVEELYEYLAARPLLKLRSRSKLGKLRLKSRR
jgi:hypothetical protein